MSFNVDSPLYCLIYLWVLKAKKRHGIAGITVLLNKILTLDDCLGKSLRIQNWKKEKNSNEIEMSYVCLCVCVCARQIVRSCVLLLISMFRCLDIQNKKFVRKRRGKCLQKADRFLHIILTKVPLDPGVCKNDNIFCHFNQRFAALIKSFCCFCT